VPVERDFPRPPDITPVLKDKSQIPLVNRARLVFGPKSPEPVAVVSPRSCAESTAGGDKTMPPAGSETTLSAIVFSSNRPSAAQSVGIPESRISRGDSWLKEKVYGLLRPPLSPVTWPLAILFSLFWGAMHALTPGHGKTIAGAYLAGAGASYRQALILGLATTLSHTAVVFVLAVAGYVMRGTMTYPVWLEGAGAAVILVVGLNQIRIGLLGLIGSAHGHEQGEGHVHIENGVHHHAHGSSKCDGDHEHTHTHWGVSRHAHAHIDHEAGKPRSSLFSLAAIGVSGGMVPCPAAIILLLLSWQLAVPGLGFACLIAFSFGLAGTLVGVGLLAVSGKNLVVRLLDKKGDQHRSYAFKAWLPILGGVILMAMGVVILTGI
jgi:ABC-type nickel/cobalt efflux system permease component RcnA